MVDEIARRIRDNFTAGRHVWLELSNEIWNAGMYPITYFHRHESAALSSQPCRATSSTSSARGKSGSGSATNSTRADGNREVGDQGGAQHAPQDSRRTPGISLALAQAHGVEVAGIAIGPYTDSDPSSASVTAYTNYDTSQCVDLWIHDIYHNVSGDVRAGPTCSRPSTDTSTPTTRPPASTALVRLRGWRPVCAPDVQRRRSSGT